MTQVADIRAILFDLDGTLYIGDAPIDGARATLAYLREKSYTLRFLTNTTTKSQAQILVNLQQMGFDIAEDELISAPVAARLELAAINQKMSKPIRIWPLVDDAIKTDFDMFDYDDQMPDYVVLGDIGERWNLALINHLFNVLHSGAQLIALHKNRFWQTTSGLKADIGFFIAGFEYVCSKKALVMGKPNQDFFNRVLASAKVPAHQALMVGDDIDSDIDGAQQLGIRGALVETGKFRQHYFEQSDVKPNHVIASMVQLQQML
ncbi:MAG TPA: TIGR01458 family HAD-type hydrolase [Marinagarivorans sp.]